MASPDTPRVLVILFIAGGVFFVFMGLALAIPGGYFSVKASSGGIEFWQYFIKSKTIKWVSVKDCIVKKLTKQTRRPFSLHTRDVIEKRVALHLDSGRELVLTFDFEVPPEEMCEKLTELKSQFGVQSVESPSS